MNNAFKMGLCIASLSLAAYSEASTTSAPTFGEYHEPIAKLKASAKPKSLRYQGSA